MRYITSFITYTKTTFKTAFNLTNRVYTCISWHFLNAKMTEQFTGTLPPILHSIENFLYSLLAAVH